MTQGPVLLGDAADGLLTMPLSHLVVVACGGAIGAVLRAMAGVLLRGRMPGLLPPTIVVNVAGSLLIGLAVPLLAKSSGGSRAFVVTGLLGAFTTFSTYSLETVELIQQRQYGGAAVYAIGSLVAGLFAVAIGLWIGTRLTR